MPVYGTIFQIKLFLLDKANEIEREIFSINQIGRRIGQNKKLTENKIREDQKISSRIQRIIDRIRLS